MAFGAVTLAGCAGNSTDAKSPPEAKRRRIGVVAGAGGFEKMAITNRTFFDALGEAGYVHGKTMDVGVRLVPMPVTRAEDLDGAITRALQEKAQIGIGLLGPDTYAIRKEIAESATTRRFPIVMDTPGGYTDMGGVATVGVNIVPYYRRGAVEQMIPLLQGKRPSDLSWVGLQRVDVTVNEAGARSFGLMVPIVPK